MREENAIRGIHGALPWVIQRGEGRLRADGEIEVRVEGLVLDPNDSEVGERGLAGRNPVESFKVVVSCITLDENGKPKILNVETDLFPADERGNSRIQDVVRVPTPCIAPILFVTSSNGAWLAVTGLPEEKNREMPNQADPLVRLERQGDNIFISWLGNGVLQVNDSCTGSGSWVDVPGAASPFMASVLEKKKFWRLRGATIASPAHAGESEPQTESELDDKIVEFDTLIGVPRPFAHLDEKVRETNAIQGIQGGGLPWVIECAKGELRVDGGIEVEVDGLVVDPGDTQALELGLGGRNPARFFKAISKLYHQRRGWKTRGSERRYRGVPC